MRLATGHRGCIDSHGLYFRLPSVGYGTEQILPTSLLRPACGEPETGSHPLAGTCMALLAILSTLSSSLSTDALATDERIDLMASFDMGCH